MIKILVVITACVGLAPVALAEPQEWQRAAQSCAERMHMSGQCGAAPNCNRQWPEISRCVIRDVYPNRFSPGHVETCIQIERTRDLERPLGYDRVRGTMLCLLESEKASHAR